MNAKKIVFYLILGTFIISLASSQAYAHSKGTCHTISQYNQEGQTQWVELYTDINIGGSCYYWNSDDNNFADEDMNDKASSCWIKPELYGLKYVELCVNQNYNNCYRHDPDPSNQGKCGLQHNDVYSSLRFRDYLPDETIQKCQQGGNTWITGASAPGPCCNGNDVFASGDKLCQSGTNIWTCNVNTNLGETHNTPAGTFVCSAGNQWLQPAQSCQAANGDLRNELGSNACCGDLPWSDVGAVENDSIGNYYICINTVPYTFYEPETNWKWLKMDDTGAPFTIRGINKTGGIPKYDAISNSDKWFSCGINAGAYGLPNPATFLTTLINTPGGIGGGIGSNLGGGVGGSGSGGTGGTPNGVINGNTFFGDVNISQGSSGINQGASLTMFPPSPIQSDVPKQIRLIGSSFAGTSIAKDTIQLRNSTNSIITTNNPAVTFTSGAFDINVGLAPLSPDTYDILIQTSGAGAAAYTFSDIFEADPSAGPGPGGIPIIPNAARFMCYAEEAHGAFAECCGISFFNCINDRPNQRLTDPVFPYPKTNRAGEPLNLIEDYFDRSSTPDYTSNYVMRWGFFAPNQNPFYVWSVPVPDVTTGRLENPMRLKDWTTYDSLEFDIAFTNSNDLTIEVFNRNSEAVALLGAGIDADYSIIGQPIFNASVRTYSIDGDGLFSWHHVRIPIFAILNSDEIGFIRFREEGNNVQSAITNRPIQNWQDWVIYGIDRVHLRRNSEINITNFCSTNGTWITDLDLDAVACENTVTTHWTANKCCGDDQARNNATLGFQIETFNDKNAGCWRGRTVRDDQMVNIIFWPTGVQLLGVTDE